MEGDVTSLSAPGGDPPKEALCIPRAFPSSHRRDAINEGAVFRSPSVGLVRPCRAPLNHPMLSEVLPCSVRVAVSPRVSS